MKHLHKIYLAIGFLLAIYFMASSGAPRDEFKIEFEPSLGAIASAQTNNGLVGYWSFEDATGTKATDFTGRGFTGTFVDSPTWVNGKRGKALSFDGSNDWIRVTNFTPTLNGSVDFTISSWIKTSSGTCQGVIAQRGTGTGLNGPVAGLNTNGKQRMWDTDTWTPDSTNAVTYGEWNHVVWSKSGATTTYYLNGVSNGAVAVDTTDWGPSTDVSIGAWDEGSACPFSGQIDEVRIYSSALSATEVLALYNSGSAKISAPNNNGLVGYWSFEDATGTKATDFSGNGKTGTLLPSTSTPTWANGKRGKALSFDGTNDRVSSAQVVTSFPLSIAAWINPERMGASTYGNAIFYQGTGSADGGLSFTIINWFGSDTLFYGNGSGSTISLESDIITTNVWQHVAITVNASGTLNFYVNGNFISTATNVDFAATPPTQNSYLGAYYDFSDSQRFFQGKMDEVRVYNRALSATEVTALYNSGSVRVNAPNNNGLVGYWSMEDATGTQAGDFSGNGNTGTLLPSTSTPTWVNGKRGKALSFDGTNDYVNIADSASLRIASTTTITAWVYPTAYNANGAQIVQKRSITAASLDYNYGFWLDGSGYQFFQFYDGTGYHNYTDNQIVPLNQWSLITVTVNEGSGTPLQFYLNASSTSAPSYSGSMVSSTAPVQIGNYSLNLSLYGFTGRIDEVRVYNRILSAAEILNLYNTAR